MKQLLESIDLVSLSAGIVAVISAITSLVVAIISSRNSKKVGDALEAAKARETYVVCPGCKKKIPLSEINFHLPSGDLDNNLNGKPDFNE